MINKTIFQYSDSRWEVLTLLLITPQMEAHIMKKYVLNNKKMRIVALALALGGAPFLTSFQLKADQADEYRGEIEQEHKMLVEIFSEFAQYGNASAGFNDYFFQVTKSCPQITGSSAEIKPSKAIFLTLSKKLLEKINGIKAKIAQYKQKVQTEDNKKLLGHLEELTTLLATSQTKLYDNFQKYLGTPLFVNAINRFANEEEKKQKPKLDKLKKTINALLMIHAEQKLKQQFDKFVERIEYSVSFPEKNWPKVQGIVLRYKGLK